ncbi:hypothetical protein EGI26_11080 [Lacihabitans sp. CCS-44]|uniref:hypothetical protein n=1 Tax=Lacihabitans sp. CCS-44 TaxID=2487331 RepID=UPI0020CEC338|nr:hypothetical protein [Lacihabitans sp. CCS-44]MCP9755698.1 hypothetical protein [Lacihabitans sp. CCS-44]
MQLSEEKQAAILEVFGGFLGEDIVRGANGEALHFHILKKLDFAILTLVESTDADIQAAGLKTSLTHLLAVRNTLFYGNPFVDLDLYQK